MLINNSVYLLDGWEEGGGKTEGREYELISSMSEFQLNFV